MVLTATIIWITAGLIVAAIANTRGHCGCGWFTMGLLFAMFVLIVAVAIPKNEDVLTERNITSGARKKCPAWGELIRVAASRCRYCGLRSQLNR